MELRLHDLYKSLIMRFYYIGILLGCTLGSVLEDDTSAKEDALSSKIVSSGTGYDADAEGIIDEKVVRAQETPEPVGCTLGSVLEDDTWAKEDALSSITASGEESLKAGADGVFEDSSVPLETESADPVDEVEGREEVESQTDKAPLLPFGIYESSDGEEIYYRFWEPSDEMVSALVVVVHGMAEHSERYTSYGKELVNNLPVRVVAPDLRGHGLTGCRDSADQSSSVLGKLHRGARAECKDAVTLMSEDVIGIINQISAEYEAGDKLNIILFGHSMGSVIVRALLKNAYHDLLKRIKGVVLSGVPAPPSLLEVLPLTVVGEFIKRTGWGAEYVKKNFVTGKFDSLLKARLRLDSVEENSFISSDSDQVKRFSRGELTNHLVDPEIMLSVLSHLRALQFPYTYFSNLEFFRELPFLFVSGTDDPVCLFGATSAADAQNMRALGHPVDEFLFGNARHELINEVEPLRTKAIKLIALWIGFRAV